MSKTSGYIGRDFPSVEPREMCYAEETNVDAHGKERERERARVREGE